MHFGKGFCQREAKTGAIKIAITRIADLFEGLTLTGRSFSWNSNAIVENAQ